MSGNPCQLEFWYHQVWKLYQYKESLRHVCLGRYKRFIFSLEELRVTDIRQSVTLHGNSFIFTANTIPAYKCSKDVASRLFCEVTLPRDPCFRHVVLLKHWSLSRLCCTSTNIQRLKLCHSIGLQYPATPARPDLFIIHSRVFIVVGLGDFVSLHDKRNQMYEAFF